MFSAKFEVRLTEKKKYAKIANSGYQNRVKKRFKFI